MAPFYRYGGHIELIPSEEYYRILRGHEHISDVVNHVTWYWISPFKFFFFRLVYPTIYYSWRMSLTMVFGKFA